MRVNESTWKTVAYGERSRLGGLFVISFLRACEGSMRAPLPAGCRVWGGAHARESQTKKGFLRES